MTEKRWRKALARRIPGVRRALTMAAGSLLLLVLIVEVGLRVFSFSGYTRADLSPNLEMLAKARTVGHPFMGYVMRPNYHTPPDAPFGQKSHNEHGLRGPAVDLEKPDDVYRIVCVGGSSTYGNSPSSDAATWPARLEHWLNEAPLSKRVQVLNAGAPGWSTFESTVNLEFRMLEWSPDLVIVYLAINDMRCALWPNPVSDNSHWRAVWPVVLDTPGERLLEHSMTYLVWRKHFTDYLEHFESLNIYAIVGYDPDDPDPYERGTVPDQGFRNYERNLITLQAIARAHGAQVIFATQACDRTYIKAKSRHNQFAGLDRCEEILRRVAAERDVILVDARAELEGEAQRVGKDLIFTKEVHLTDQGADQLARIFAGAVISGELVK